MLVSNSFDLWQKDTFFSAAEEVQQSADIMESAYRAWLRARREGLTPQHLDALGRELQTALGTAKWQLEEFERAVCQSYRNIGDDITMTRHRQFVSAIEDQISRVETSLKESYVEGKKPFRWVNLDEEECDDLAHFLSGTSETSQLIKDGGTDLGSTVPRSRSKSNRKEDCDFGSEISKMRMSNPGESSEEILMSVEDITSNHPAWSSPDRNVLEIVIDRDDRQTSASIEATPKKKGSKLFSWGARGGNDPTAKELKSHPQMKMINWINNHLRGGHRSQRLQAPPVLPVKSIRFALAFMLTIFLVVPFLLHST
ncbi:hypothetical protein ACS0TY_031141 [Phlomoides rotata]